ncbi:ribosomal RNA small subunit methyltransferase A [Candidatus Bathyarchaeota archaeon]|nr:ribosomal RNA small subunit methyltransferase A [Candidatus Bathyarchaeota archaeon]
MEKINLLQKTKHLLRFYNLFPKKRLGQNFTVNSEILENLVSYASLTKDDVVLEIGAGFGFLTRLLFGKCKKIIAVEIDPQLVNFLKKQFHNYKNIDLIEGDILKISTPEFSKVVAAPPYSISSPLLFHILEKSFNYAVLIFQKEFAERLAASVGTKKYGRLSVNIYYRAEVELLDTVPRTMFFPQPDIDSKIVRIKPRAPPFYVKDEMTFFEIVRTLFTQRNKKVRNALIPFLRKNEIPRKEALDFSDSTVFSSKRVQELTPEDFGILTNEVIRLL